jgi:hypothetical protein
MRNSNVIDAAFGGAVGRTQEQSRSFSRPECAPSLARVLLVEPDEARRAHLCDAVREIAHIDDEADFLIARTHLFSKRYDWLVTNTRLGAYNGLHLMHLAVTSRLPIRFLIYADRRDLCLAREAQRIGAFYESPDRVDRALPAYLRCALPPQDRRNPAQPDRRANSGGSRRCTDIPSRS